MAKVRGVDSKSPVKEQPSEFSRAFMLQQERSRLAARIHQIDAELRQNTNNGYR